MIDAIQNEKLKATLKAELNQSKGEKDFAEVVEFVLEFADQALIEDEEYESLKETKDITNQQMEFGDERSDQESEDVDMSEPEPVIKKTKAKVKAKVKPTQ